jgi:hypothetical protein
VSGGAVSALAELLAAEPAPEVQAAGLRCLGCLCCVAEGGAAVLRSAGLPLVLAALGPHRGEGERREAAGVLAQLSSHGLEEPGTLEAVARHLPPVLAALTDLTLATSSMETFLLCTAALANLTSLHPAAAPLLLSAGLLPALLAHPSATSSSPYVQDQLVTLLANMARLGSAREEMVRAGALPLLLGLLAHRPGPDPALALAWDRTLAKAAIALARLCLERGPAELALGLGAGTLLAGLAGSGSEVWSQILFTKLINTIYIAHKYDYQNS